MLRVSGKRRIVLGFTPHLFQYVAFPLCNPRYAVYSFRCRSLWRGQNITFDILHNRYHEMITSLHTSLQEA